MRWASKKECQTESNSITYITNQLSDLFADEVGHHNNDSCASDNDLKNKKNPEIVLKNVVANVGINNDEVDDLGNKDALHLNDGLAGNKDTANDGVQHDQDNQHNPFGGPIHNENNLTILVVLIKRTN